MLSVVENVLLGNGNGFDKHRASLDGQMHAIVEDESSSGGSGQSNSDSSSSQKGKCFDKDRVLEGIERLALEFYQGEHLSKYESFCKTNVAESCGTKKGSKKPTRWLEVFNLFGNKHKLNNNKEKPQGGGETVTAALLGLENPAAAPTSLLGIHAAALLISLGIHDMTRLNYSKKKVAERAASANFGRDAFVLERNKSVKCSSNDIDNSTLPFYLMPLRTSRSRKSTENKLTKPLHATGNVFTE
ncbi:hypothetical protein HAX54_025220 [Datura stramonium]|uniref:Uncharacterized protein n=1 Tax=Datura stramonium TaxID=4076 RepID=A0ABS8S6L6_DATST|nr:hypothetical protein [Datura stramonium]